MKSQPDRFETLWEFAPIALLKINSKGQIILVNRAFLQLFEYTKEEILGQPLEVLIPSRYAHHSQYVQKYLENPYYRPMGAGPEIWARKKTGKEFPVDITLSPIQKEDELLVMAAVKDLTEIKKYEESLKKYNAYLEEEVRQRTRHLEEKNLELIKQKEEAEKLRFLADQANQAKSQFVANISHEIRTPLNSVLGLVHLLETTSLDSKQEKYIRKLKLSLSHLMDLLNEVLDFSKVTKAKPVLEKTEFQLYKVVDEIVEIFYPSIEMKDLEFFLEYDLSIPSHLIGDSQKIFQILSNLIKNAIKFTEKGEIILRVLGQTIPSQEKKVLVSFSVQDTGKGLDPKKKKEIFEPFVQEDSDISRDYGGTGLGLAITKAYVEAMEGTIEVQSFPGRGSIFTVQIPLEISSQAFQSTTYDFRGKKAFVIASNTSFLANAHFLLHQFGFHVITFTSPTEALKEIQNMDHGSHMVLVDKEITSSTPEKIAEEIQNPSQNKGASFLLLLAKKELEEIPSSLSQKYTYILDKPLRPSQIMNLLVEYFFKDKMKSPRLAKKILPSQKLLFGEHILVVEDNPTCQEVVKDILEESGASVTIAGDGQDCLKKLGSNANYSLILLDLQLPKMNGKEIALAIRTELGLELPIVALTSEREEDEAEACLEAGMDGFLSKPLEVKKLYSLIKYLKKQKPPKKGNEISSPLTPHDIPSDMMEELHHLADLLESYDGSSLDYIEYCCFQKEEFESLWLALQKEVQSYEFEKALEILYAFFPDLKPDNKERERE
ncbi:MAG: response regulator [Planctomycetota bacterium]|nr:MAG: response regulator [Planctomycetota bacterium]